MMRGEVMRESAIRMLQAMKRGHSVTPMNGPLLCGTTAVSQRFQELRDAVGVTEVITSERVPGHRYHRYYIKGAAKKLTKQTSGPVVVSSYVRNPIAEAPTDNQLVMFFGAC